MDAHKQFGLVSVVCPLVPGAGQPHHGLSLRIQYGVVRRASPVSVGQSARSLLSVSVEETSCVAFAKPEKLGGLTDRDLVLQNVVEHVQFR